MKRITTVYQALTSKKYQYQNISGRCPCPVFVIELHDEDLELFLCMKEIARFEDIRAEEKESREQRRSLLEGLSGFSRLSPRQKRYLTTSLYIQQRAERGTDPISAARINDMPEEFRKFLGSPDGAYITSPMFSDSNKLKESDIKKYTDRYFESQISIMSDFCHRVITKLEDYREGELLSVSWVDVGPVTSFSDVEELVALATEQNDFPLVVQIWKGKPEEDNLTNLLHSFILLGKDDGGKYLVWEKSGCNMPFQIISLKQVYENYEHAIGWRMRQLSV